MLTLIILTAVVLWYLRLFFFRDGRDAVPGQKSGGEGRIIVHRNPRRKEKKTKRELLKDFGEYIDFEEV